MERRSFFTSQTAVRIYIVLASLFIIVFALDSFVLPGLIHSRGETVIPDVVGKSYDEAASLLRGKNLTPVNGGETPNRKIKKGNIAFQNPSPGSTVRQGRNVYLTLSAGERRVSIPNLRGKSLRDAKITLEQLELKVGMVTYAPSELPPDIIVGQNVAAGKEALAGTAVDITVSAGKNMLQLDVPFIIGVPLDEAQATLLKHGLRVGKIELKASPNIAPKTVINQSPSAGDRVDAGTPIDVVVAQ